MQLRVLLRYPGILCALVVADIVTVVVQSRLVSRICNSNRFECPIESAESSAQGQKLSLGCSHLAPVALAPLQIHLARDAMVMCLYPKLCGRKNRGEMKLVVQC